MTQLVRSIRWQEEQVCEMESDDPVSPLSAQASSRTQEARTDFPLLRLPTSETLYSSICIIKRSCKGPWGGLEDAGAHMWTDCG